jgi:hypothetical protein
MSDAKAPELKSIKTNRTKAGTRGQEVRDQVEHIDSAGAKLVYQGCLVPGQVITDDTSSAARLVGAGSILRIQVGADTYVAFGDDQLGAVTASTSPGLKLPAGYHTVIATSDWIRTSAALTRLEVVSV